MKLNIAEYARHRGCDPSTVRFALQRGRIRFGEDKLIDAEQADRDWAKNTNHAQARPNGGRKAVAPGEFNNKRHRLGQTSKSGVTYADSRAMKEAIEAQLKQLELDEKTGKLIDREKVVSAIETHYRRLRDSLLNLPIRVSAQVAAATDARDVHEMLEAAVREVLEGFRGVPI